MRLYQGRGAVRSAEARERGTIYTHRHGSGPAGIIGNYFKRGIYFEQGRGHLCLRASSLCGVQLELKSGFENLVKAVHAPRMLILRFHELKLIVYIYNGYFK